MIDFLTSDLICPYCKRKIDCGFNVDENTFIHTKCMGKIKIIKGELHSIGICDPFLRDFSVQFVSWTGEPYLKPNMDLNPSN